MKKIVLANIGNRNLKFKEETYFSKTHGSTFREWTKNLLDNFEENKPLLTINILNDLLDSLNGEIEQVILFPSNQINEEKQDQDTLFEGEILQRLIEEKYHVAVDSSKQVTCKVTDNDALLRFYRKELKSIKQNFPSHKLVICDAGGTAQQKSALKIMAEFLLDEADYQVSYVNPNGILEDVTQLEYKKVIETEQLTALVKSGDFKAAQQLAIRQDWIEIAILCQIGYLRLEHLWNDAQKLVLKEWGNDEYKFLKAFKSEKTSSTYDALKPFFKKKHNFFLICEQFQIAEYHFLAKNFTQTAIATSIFIEAFINELISGNSAFKLSENYHKNSEILLNEIDANFEDIKNFFGGKIRSGLPLHIIFAETLFSSDEPNISQILDCIKTLNGRINGTSKGVDSLRNNVAHNGAGITEFEFNQALPNFSTYFNTIKNCLGLSSINPLIELQELIATKIKEL